MNGEHIKKLAKIGKDAFDKRIKEKFDEDNGWMFDDGITQKEPDAINKALIKKYKLEKVTASDKYLKDLNKRGKLFFKLLSFDKCLQNDLNLSTLDAALHICENTLGDGVIVLRIEQEKRRVTQDPLITTVRVYYTYN